MLHPCINVYNSVSTKFVACIHKYITECIQIENNHIKIFPIWYDFPVRTSYNIFCKLIL